MPCVRAQRPGSLQNLFAADVLTVSNRVCELFDDAADAQKSYLISLMNYRSSLKDVAAREAEIRVILRDRDIFVSRVGRCNDRATLD